MIISLAGQQLQLKMEKFIQSWSGNEFVEVEIAFELSYRGLGYVWVEVGKKKKKEIWITPSMTIWIFHEVQVIFH